MRDYASLYNRLLADLDLQSWTGDSLMSSDMGYIRAASQSLATSFYKKLCPRGNSRDADTNALIKFKAINARLPERFEFCAESEVESCFWDYFRSNLNACVGPHESIGAFDLDSIREGMMAGPGAAQKADSSTLLSKLFESPMSYTNPFLVPYYRAALAETGFWADAEMRRNQKYGFVRVEGGKLFFAPKNAEISRTCCTEANMNMLVQKSIGTFLEFRLGWYFGISLDTQPDRNRELARLGSIDGSFGTIDLTSASDSMILDMLQQALDRSFLKTMMWASRSEVATLPSGETVKLNMISTMGNGFTFPLQTIVFASAVRSVYQLMGFPSDCSRTQFGVFGDDIIVRREAYEFLCRMLRKLGFEVNTGKSFNSGPFRESCGHDYYLGHNVRGVYVKSLECPQQVYSLINRLNRWTAYHGIPLTQTISLLLSWIRDIRVPPSEADDAGIHVPFKATTPVLTPQYWFKYRAYRRRVKRLTLAEPDADGSTVNQDGFAVTVMSGHTRRRDVSLTSTDDSAWKHDWAFSVTLRDRVGARPRYQIVNKSIPYWDYLPEKADDSRADLINSGWLPNPKMATGRVDYDEWRISLTADRYRAWERAVLAVLSSR
jgi:hypothetical protein